MKKIVTLLSIIFITAIIIGGYLYLYDKPNNEKEENYEYVQHTYGDYSFTYPIDKYSVYVNEPKPTGPEVWGVQMGGVKIKDDEGGQIYIVLLNKRFMSEYDEAAWVGMNEGDMYELTVDRKVAKLYEMDGDFFQRERVFLLCGYILRDEYVCVFKIKEEDTYYELEVNALGYEASQIVMKFRDEEEFTNKIEEYLELIKSVLNARKNITSTKNIQNKY
jgi:glucose uptake protein GlcU